MSQKKHHGPPHPGQVLGQYLHGLSVSEVARALGVSRSTLSRILSGVSGVSADMAIRIGLALDTSPDLWAGLQMRYDLHQAGLQKRPRVKRLLGPVKNESALELKGMFAAPARKHVSIEEMRVKLHVNGKA